MWDSVPYDFEHKLQINGNSKLQEYKEKLKTHNNVSYINRLESYLLDAVNTSNEGYVSERGEVERWVGGINKEKLVKDIVQNAEEARKKLKNKIND